MMMTMPSSLTAPRGAAVGTASASALERPRSSSSFSAGNGGGSGTTTTLLRGQQQAAALAAASAYASNTGAMSSSGGYIGTSPSHYGASAPQTRQPSIYTTTSPYSPGLTTTTTTSGFYSSTTQPAASQLSSSSVAASPSQSNGAGYTTAATAMYSTAPAGLTAARGTPAGAPPPSQSPYSGSASVPQQYTQSASATASPSLVQQYAFNYQATLQRSNSSNLQHQDEQRHQLLLQQQQQQQLVLQQRRATAATSSATSYTGLGEGYGTPVSYSGGTPPTAATSYGFAAVSGGSRLQSQASPATASPPALSSFRPSPLGGAANTSLPSPALAVERSAVSYSAAYQGTYLHLIFH